MSGHVKVAGAWKNVTGASVKVAGAWKSLAGGYTRISGVWKQWFFGGTPAYYLIGSATVSYNTTTINFYNLPVGDYEHFEIVIKGRSTANNSDLFFNTSGGLYSQSRLFGEFGESRYGETAIRLDDMLPGSFYPGGWGVVRITMTNFKNGFYQQYNTFAYAGSRDDVYLVAGVRSNTATPNSVQLSSGSYLELGTTASIYGVK